VKRLASILAVLGLLAVLARAQGGEETYERVELRVGIAVSDGRVLVDRGASDGVQVGDLVVLQPRGAAAARGLVVQVDERSAIVELTDFLGVPPEGTRGIVFLPSSRFAPPPTPPPAEGGGAGAGGGTEPEGEGGGSAEAAPAEPSAADRWRNQDEAWREGMPLLARVRPERPEERNPRWSGRWYTRADFRSTFDDGRSDSFLRTGADFVFENPFLRGGALHFDGEINHRTTNLDDQGDESIAYGRLDRLSYRIGGHRFAQDRLEVGRFLQTGMPEFGVLDGAEWIRRQVNGHSWGASMGFLPQPNPTMSTGDDFQIAAHYRWIADQSELLSFAGGLQKTFHNGAADRDLLVAKLDYLPQEGWDFRGTTWVDFYGDGDDEKGTGIDLTQARFSTGRRFENGDRLDVTFRHLRFPDIERNEFRPIVDDELADRRYERLSVGGWHWLGGRDRFHGEVGLWNDQDETGGDFEAGIDFKDLFTKRSQTDCVLFGTHGRFETVAGVRFLFTKYTDDGLWEGFYEVADHRQQGFSSDRDDIFQHRTRVSRTLRTAAGWDLSAYGQAILWDDETDWSIGLYLQKSF